MTKASSSQNHSSRNRSSQNRSSQDQAGLVWQGSASLSWDYLDSLPQGHALTHLNQTAENVLRQLAQLDETSQDLGEESPGVAREFERLESMVSLLIRLVGQLLSQQLQIPDAVAVSLSAKGIEWSGADQPEPGRAVLVRIFLHPDIPQALELAGETVAGTGSGGVAVNFYGVSEHTQEWLEKSIFRFHRRSIAHSRMVR